MMAETNNRQFSLHFLKPYEYALDLIIADHERTGECKLQLGKKGFLRIVSALMLPKDTPYRKSIAIG